MFILSFLAYDYIQSSSRVQSQGSRSRILQHIFFNAYNILRNILSVKEGKTTSKFLALESLRGVAALAVVFDHFFRTFYPHTFVSSQVAHSRYEWLFSDTPLFAMINGAFAVTVFFMLSGFVLSYSHFRKKSDLVSSTLKRYFRLTPIVLASTMLGFFLLKFGLFFNTQADLMPYSWKDSDITLLQALWQGTIGTYITQPNDQSLNSVLWTIYHELIGSVIVFAVIALVQGDKRRGYIYAMLSIILLGTPYIGFIIGLIIADIYWHKPVIVEKVRSMRTSYRIPLLILAIYAASFPPLRDENTLSMIHKPLLLFSHYPLSMTVVHLVAAAIFIVLLLCSRGAMQRFFTIRPLVALGSISYSLYAVHLLVMGSLGCYVFYISQQAHASYIQSSLMAGAAYLSTSLVLATIFNRYIDKPSTQFSATAVAKILRR